MTRAQLVAEVAGLLRETLALANLAPTDTAGDLREPVNAAFRALGVAEADLAAAAVPDGDEARAVAYARCLAAERAVDGVAELADAGAARGAYLKESQSADRVARQRDRACAEANRWGLGYAGGAAPVPYGGGIAAGDYAGVAGDGDRIPPFFAGGPG